MSVGSQGSLLERGGLCAGGRQCLCDVDPGGSECRVSFSDKRVRCGRGCWHVPPEDRVPDRVNRWPAARAPMATNTTSVRGVGDNRGTNLSRVRRSGDERRWGGRDRVRTSRDDRSCRSERSWSRSSDRLGTRDWGSTTSRRRAHFDCWVCCSDGRSNRRR